MKTYEVINPSDPYTFCAPDRQIAALTIFLLSTSFAATCVSHPGEDEDVPLFLLGGAKEWWDATFPEDEIKGTLDRRLEEVADALESMLYGHLDDRDSFRKLAEPIDNSTVLRDMRIKWNDERRSSMNDISASSYSIAQGLRDSRSKEG